VAVIGGSGFYELLADAEAYEVESPYGPASGPVTLGRLAGRAVAFLPRHGPRHSIPPHRINYRANLWALAHLGVTRVIAPCAVGSLRPDLHPGEFVVCDQFVDRTWGRADTFYDGPVVHHVSTADPYCPELAEAVAAGLAGAGAAVHRGGTVVVVQGPRFSTRAESAWFRRAGWSVVNMTQYPEVTLARELGLCYAAVALVTDYDTGVEGEEPVPAVTMAAVWEVLEKMVGTVRATLSRTIDALADRRACGCAVSGGPALDLAYRAGPGGEDGGRPIA
jgi:5'-methylthioadenosine phosphorylase